MIDYTFHFVELDGERTEDVEACACCACEVPLAWFEDRIHGDHYHCEVCATSNIPSRVREGNPEARILAQVVNHVKEWIVRTYPPIPEA